MNYLIRILKKSWEISKINFYKVINSNMKKLELKIPPFLNKKVISDLTNDKMSYIRGGDSSFGEGDPNQGLMTIGRCDNGGAFTDYSKGIFCKGPRCQGDVPI